MPVYQLAQAQIKGVTLPIGWDDGWKNAKALAGSQPIWMTVLGDSIASGQNSTGTETTSWFGLLRLALIARLGGPSQDYYPAYQWSTVPTGGLSTGALPWSGLLNGLASGSTSQTVIDGWHKTFWTNAAFANWIQKFTSPYACTSMDFFYIDVTAGTFQINVDEGAAGTSFSYALVAGGTTGSTQTGTTGTPITITTAGDGTTPNSEVKKVKIFGLASGTHTISYGQTSAGNICRPMGVAIYSGNNGIGFARFQYSAAQASDYATTRPADRHVLLQGVNPQKDNASHNSPNTFGFPTQPNLLIYALGVNDCSSLIQPIGYGNTTGTLSGTGGANENFEFALRRWIEAAKRGAQPNASIVILGHNYPGPYNTDMGYANIGGFSLGYYWSQYLAAMERVARATGCAFINVEQRWGENGVGLGFLGSSGTAVHPTDAGYADIANNCILPIL